MNATRTIMRGYDEIIATYDKETMAEIANHGCSSGVCFKHIYYGDTIRFYDKYEDEILDYFTDIDGTDLLTDLFHKNSCQLDYYKNDVAWAYIESVAFRVTEDALEEPELTEYGAVA